MKIASLASPGDQVSARYRSVQFIPGLAGMGFSLEALTLPDLFADRIRFFRTLSTYDAVILHRKLFNLPNFFLFRRSVKKLIFDLDDAIFLRDSHQAGDASLTRTLRFRRTVRRADFVVAGNAFLLSEVRRFTSRCAEIPTVVDLARFPEKKVHRQRDRFQALWIGGRSTLPYLETILPYLSPAARAIPGFRLIVIADCFPAAGDVPIVKVPWTAEGEREAILKTDAGLMPLPDDAWSRGKCGLKLIQYGAAGLPSVYSPVGANRAIAVDGETGLAARTPREWCDALQTLSRSCSARARLGEAARRKVKMEFSVDAHLPSLAGLLRRVITGATG
jgi:glycosyltransferase involved in cell wall biosynthesis